MIELSACKVFDENHKGLKDDRLEFSRKITVLRLFMQLDSVNWLEMGSASKSQQNSMILVEDITLSVINTVTMSPEERDIIDK